MLGNPIITQTSEQLYSTLLDFTTPNETLRFYITGGTLGVGTTIGESLTINEIKKRLRLHIRRRLTIKKKVLVFADYNHRTISFQNTDDHPALPEGVWIITQG